MFINYEEIRRMSDNIRAMVGDDEDCFLDTLDGETDAMDVLGKLIQERQEIQANEAAVKALAKIYQERAARLNAKADAISQTIGHLLDAIGSKKVAHPLATVSRTKARQSVLVTNPEEIPTQLTKVKRSPDLAAIKEQLEAGEFVPGAEIKLGNPGVTVRVK
ncbi:MAG: siphovirus Gp157 family protein [Paracoccaceae bacterium]